MAADGSLVISEPVLQKSNPTALPVVARKSNEKRAYFVRRVHKLSLPLSIDLRARCSERRTRLEELFGTGEG